MRRRIVVVTVLAGVLAFGIWTWLVLKVPARLEAVPTERSFDAVIPGIPNARYWVGVDIDPMVRDVVAARERERAWRLANGLGDRLPPADLLAVSGGGDKGAFGAGLLIGWTERGDRPEFKAVTGVSTGALIAPFAFLGPEYDDVLRAVYTTVAPQDILQPRGLLAAIENDGMADNQPLRQLISRYVDQALLDRIAEEHAKGRILLVGTTDLDSRQPIIWNLGNIAASGAPNALELFRQLLLASAAIPGAFPPTMIRVEVDGIAYEEMHVDGGAATQVFLYPPRLRTAADNLGDELERAGRVFIIRNAAFDPSWDPVPRRTIDIAGRAIQSLIYTQGLGDLYRIYVTTQRDGFDFNLAFIGRDFVYEAAHESFDTAYMRSLFDYGFNLGRAGYDWSKSPPGLDDEF